MNRTSAVVMGGIVVGLGVGFTLNVHNDSPPAPSPAPATPTGTPAPIGIGSAVTKGLADTPSWLDLYIPMITGTGDQYIPVDRPSSVGSR